MRMTSTGAFPRALAAASPPKPPPTITTRGVFDVRSPAPLIELRLASFIHPFLKLLRPEISENLQFTCRPLTQAFVFFIAVDWAQLFVEQLRLRRREFLHFFLVNFRIP